MRHRSGWIAALVGVGALGCGGGDEAVSNTGGPRMTEAAARAPDASRANQAPRIESVRFEPATPRAGEPIRAVVRAIDPEGDPVQLGFVWTVRGMPVREGGDQVTLSHATRGDRVSVRVTASDGRAESVPHEAFTSLRNSAPLLEALEIDPADRVVTDNEISVRPRASDADRDQISFEYTWTVNGDPAPTNGPALSTRELRRDDVVQVRVSATDGTDRSEEVSSHELRIGNRPPRFVSEPGVTDEDGVFRYRVRVDDPDRDRTLRFRLGEAPEGMTITSTRGEIEWAPQPDQAGLHPIEIVVEDLQGGSAAQRFELEVGVEEIDTSQASPAAPAE